MWDAEDEKGKPLSAEQKKDALRKLKEDTNMARRVEQSRPGKTGDVTATRSVDTLLKPKESWEHQLRGFFTATGRPRGRGWHAFDRRRAQIGMWEPAEVKESVDWIVAFWDVSGSMDWPAHRALLSQLKQIRKKTEVSRLTIVPFNNRVLTNRIVEVRPKDKLPQKFAIDGGTSFDAAFQWLQGQRTPSGVLVFTDLQDHCRVKPPSAPVVWVSSDPVTNYNRPPFGKTIEIDLTERD